MRVSYRTLGTALGLLIAVSFALTPGVTGRRSHMTLAGSVASAQEARSYNQFVLNAYQAVGRFPSCAQRAAEYDALANAAAAGTLRQEAARFVSTLFETQASFDDQGGSYCQDAYYDVRNPAGCDPFVNTRSDEFITDLYHAFLQREPEQAGFDGWMSTIPTAGRKGVLNGFRDSTEFGVVVDMLYDDGAPSCGTTGGGGGGGLCSGTLFYKKYCQ